MQNKYPSLSKEYLWNLVNDELNDSNKVSYNFYGTSLIAKKSTGWKGITVDQMGAILDTAIGAALGGIAAGGVQAALKHLSKKAARRVIRQALIRKFGRLGAITSGAIDLAMNYSSPGHWLAKYWDKHDKYPNNGRINF